MISKLRFNSSFSDYGRERQVGDSSVVRKLVFGEEGKWQIFQSYVELTRTESKTENVGDRRNSTF